jgi:tight adherence protein B
MTLITLLWIGGGIALALLVVGIVVTVSSERSTVEERMGRYIDSGQIIEEQGKRPSPLTNWFNARVQKSSLGDNISKSLARADIKLTPGEYIALIVISMIGVGIVGFALGGWNYVTAAIGAGIGFFLPDFYVKREQSKRLSKFNDQLSDMLNLMVNGLRAGFSTMQAMEAVSKELPSPICDEFRRVVQEMQLGVSMEKALDNLLRRIPSDDLDLTLHYSRTCPRQR